MQNDLATAIVTTAYKVRSCAAHGQANRTETDARPVITGKVRVQPEMVRCQRRPGCGGRQADDGQVKWPRRDITTTYATQSCLSFANCKHNLNEFKRITCATQLPLSKLATLQGAVLSRIDPFRAAMPLSYGMCMCMWTAGFC